MRPILLTCPKEEVEIMRRAVQASNVRNNNFAEYQAEVRDEYEANGYIELEWWTMTSSSTGKRSGSSSGNSSRTCLTASMSPIYVQEEQQKEEHDYNSESEEEGEADMSPEWKFE